MTMQKTQGGALPIGWSPLNDLEATRRIVQAMLDAGLARRPLKVMTPEEFEIEKKKLCEKEFRERKKSYGPEQS